jgi:hypothetical protein
MLQDSSASSRAAAARHVEVLTMICFLLLCPLWALQEGIRRSRCQAEVQVQPSADEPLRECCCSSVLLVLQTCLLLQYCMLLDALQSQLFNDWCNCLVKVFMPAAALSPDHTIQHTSAKVTLVAVAVSLLWCLFCGCCCSTSSATRCTLTGSTHAGKTEQAASQPGHCCGASAVRAVGSK